MTMSFFEFLGQRCRRAGSLLCLGLDPHAEDLEQSTAAAAREFCLQLIEATAPFAAAFKPNSAFFEVYGADGIQALQDVIAAVPEDIPVILDAKRGDIGSTAQAYAQAAFQTLGAHAITVNPYLGSDSVAPFIADASKGIFILCKTSNPRAGEIQDLSLAGKRLFIQVAQLAESWNQNGNVGIVVGATYPDDLRELRRYVPELWILAPGIGTQGGELEATVQAGLRPDGLGMLINVSRGVSRAPDPAAAARYFRDEVNTAWGITKLPRKEPFQHAQLADDLLRLGCVKFGKFNLKSGAESPIYLDLRRLIGDPQVLNRAATAYTQILRSLKFDRLAGLPYAAIPIATAISLQLDKPMIYPRKESKDYGTQAMIEGPNDPGDIVLVIDDVITTGGSKLDAIEKLTSAGLRVWDIAVLIDRQVKPSKELGESGIKLHSVFRIRDLLIYWRSKGSITEEQYSQTNSFLQR